MRQRGTGIIIKNEKILLVRDKGHSQFSLPGGEIHEGEPVVSAAARELYEELGLHITTVKRLQECDFRGSRSEHRVCFIEANGKPYLRGHELDKFIWRDMKTPIKAYPHVTVILKKFKNLVSLPVENA